ncbi:MAG: hypothetical protein IT385_29075 [Deltaproteobacteria bacterium]|nr:hypothetical protein [Deltaproteobacteria bacterium]
MATRTKTEPRQRQRPTRPALEAAPDPAPPADDAPPIELVTCFMSGRVVPRDEAVLVKLGPGQRVWMLPEFCNEERRDR